jgi:hypothetical protein
LSKEVILTSRYVIIHGQFYDANELYHYGVKGMKWGVRKDEAVSSGKTSRHKNDTPSASQQAKSASQERQYLRAMEAIKNGKKSADDALYRIGSKYLSDTDLKTEEVELWDFNDGHQEYANPSKMLKDFGSSIYDKGYRGITDDDVAAVNPDYGQPGTTNNCTKCSCALELRNRGLDVRAGRQTYPASSDAVTHWFKGAVREEHLYDEAESAIKKSGPGSSGVITCFYPHGAGGHAMHWSVKNDGNFQIEDGQTGRTFKSLDEVTKKYGFLDSMVYSYRLDNCEPNYDNMVEDSVVRGPSSNISGTRDRTTGEVRDRW